MLHQVAPSEIDLDTFGVWVDSQDPLTGQIVREWAPYEGDADISTETDVRVYKEIPCLVRGIVDGGIRVAGTTERFSNDYENIDFAKMWIPANIFITKRDRVTNIRTKDGRIVWKDEEFDDPFDDVPASATVFNVNGVTPLLDAFNRHTENFVLLQRAEAS